jgi:hypothetical protein
MASLTASLTATLTASLVLFIGFGMKTARCPFESPAMQHDPVRAIIYTPSRHHRDQSSII